MIYGIVMAAGLSAVLSFSSAWIIQADRYKAKALTYENKTLAQQAQAQDLARAAQEHQATAFAAATFGAQARAITLRRDADSARAALDGLHRATANAVVASASTHDACLVRATALSELLGNCGERYTSLGAKADRHASDVKTLVDAWPKAEVRSTP